MRKLFLIIITFLFIYFPALAQDKLLLAVGNSPNLYLNHTVMAHENYYSVGRLYNTSPKELAPYNNLTFEKGLSLGQTIKIPLTPNNFTQGEAPRDNEVLVPVYHIMQPKEGLYRISVNYNKVPVDLLKKWNKLSGENIGTGSKIIIGYLKVVRDQSALASMATTVTPAEMVKIEVKRPKKIKEEEPPVKIEEKQPVSQNPKESNPTKEKVVDINTSTIIKTPINFNGGKFKGLYNDQTKSRTLISESGEAAIFKTTSGWQDGKYYCFHNTAEPGTIIKITNNANGKSIYAKVLDAIPDIKQNSGLLLRISNSAAEELGVVEGKFDCSITYAR